MPFRPVRAAANLALCLFLLTSNAGAAGTRPTVDPGDAVAIELQDLRATVEQLRAQLGQFQQPADGAKMSELERRIDVLTRTIERLSLGDAAPEATASAHGLGPAASKIYQTKSGVSLGGYGELRFTSYADDRDNGTAAGKTNEFDLVRAVLYAGYKFSDRFLFNSEIEFEHASTDKSGEVAVEFAQIDFMYRPALNFRAGLLLLPLGFINELHEPTTYLGAIRPDTEGQLIPSTWRENGVGLFGDVGRLSYRAYIVNGLRASGFAASGLRGGRQKGSKAVAEDFALTARLDYQATLGIRVGASLYAGDSGQELDDLAARTTIVDVHGQFEQRGLHARVLWARGTVDDVGPLNQRNGLEGSASIGSTLTGGYLELGYDLLARGVDANRQSLTPFVRWERLDSQSEVPTGFSRDPSRDREIVTVGAAWKPHPQIVVKADYQNVDDAAETGINQFNLGLGWIF